MEYVKQLRSGQSARRGRALIDPNDRLLNDSTHVYRLYYFFIKERGGHVYRFNISKKELPTAEEVEAKYLPYVQAWSLGYTGNEGLTSPIIKTECNITLVDVPEDEGKMYIDSELYECKTGNYEEFYTSDSTLWRVEVLEDNRTRWTGYITPDSFSEALQYHSTVSIIARDNIGHLQDLDADLTGDAYGMVSVRDIINGALAAVSAMPLDWNVTPNLFGRNNQESAEAVDLMIPREGLKDKNYFEVLRDVLDALGLVMRWNENNAFVLSDIGSLPDMFAGSYAVPDTPVLFVGRSGHRELEPAYKRVVEKFSFDTGALMVGDIAENEYKETTDTAYINGHTVSGYLPKPSTGWARYSQQILLLNPYKFNRNPYFGTNTRVDNNFFVPVFSSQYMPANSYIYKVLPITYGGANLKLSYNLNGSLFWGNPATGYLNISWGVYIYPGVLISYWGIVANYKDGTKKYYNATKGAWQNDSIRNSARVQTSTTDDGNTEISVECNIPTDTNIQSLEVRIYPIETNGFNASTFFYPDLVYAMDKLNLGEVYGKISDLKLEIANIADYDYNKVTTIYDDKNNVTYNREPQYGQVPQLCAPNAIRNGFYIPTENAGIYPAAVNFRYLTGYNTGKQDLPVWVHQQILTQYFKPMDILTGDMLADNARLTSVFTWNNKKYMLTAGEINLLNGMINGAHLREVHSFADVFEPVTESETGGGSSTDPEDVTLSTTNVVAQGVHGDTVRVQITAEAGTAWTAESTVEWVSVSPSSGSGSGTLLINIDEVDDAATHNHRTGYVKVNNQVITVTQTWRGTSDGEAAV